MTFKVYEINRTRCIRKFDNLEDAQDWVYTVNTGKSYRIEFQYPDEKTTRSIYF